MKLKEYEGKELFAKHGLAIPKGRVAHDADEVAEAVRHLPGSEVVLKAQVLVGGRGKAGGVKVVPKEQAVAAAKKMLGMRIHGEAVLELLVEEKLAIDRELYLSLIVNRAERCITLLFSPEGGVDIEELAKRAPEKIARIPLHEFNSRAVDLKWLEQGSQLLEMVKVLHRLMEKEDAQLVEVNPLVLSGKTLVCADAKVILDDNALYRHKEHERRKRLELSGLEADARDAGLQYVELDGDIAIIGNGAGLVMATLDVLAHFGGKPANFLDVGGGASVEMMERALDIALKKRVSGLFINIFGGITRCDEIAQGLINYRKEKQLKVPLVVRMIGTNEAEGRKLLEKAGIPSLDSMEEGARKMVEMVR